MAVDYFQIEAQALAIVRIDVPEVTDWKRTWTNAARREIQRRENYGWMARLHPDRSPSEIVGSWTFKVLAGDRRVALPQRFKELVDPYSGLFYFDPTTSERIAIPQLSFREAHERFSITETGAPLAHVLLPNTTTGQVQDETTILVNAQPLAEPLQPVLEVWPKPDLDYDLQIHGFFYLLDLVESSPLPTLAGASDYLLVNFDPLLVRDALCREAFLALQMWDLALRHEQARTTREDRASHAEKERELGQGLILQPNLSAGPVVPRRRRLEGYDF